MRLDSYWEEAGNPAGTPILFVHGGPGGGIEAKCRQFFDPAYYRVILFEQRGCGRSTPLGSISANTTQHLIADMEALREDRDVESWALFGGSWGSTLSLAYAQEHPERVTALVLRGIFAVRKAEVDWLYERGGAGMLAPLEFEEYLRGLPERLRGKKRLLEAFSEVFCGENEEEARAAALAWSSWEGATSYFRKPAGAMKYNDQDFAVVFARIEVSQGGVSRRRLLFCGGRFLIVWCSLFISTL
jgi:proline iminopeptidase